MNGAVPDELARILSILGGGNASVAAPQRLPTPPPAQRAPPQAAHPAPIIDPASITDWSHAAKCVTKIAAQNPRFAERIKSMIDEQHAVEKEWQQLRTQPNTQSRDAMNKLQEHLTAIRALTPIGGIQSSEATPTSSEDRKAETERFDMKCHDAMKHMDLMMSRELKGLGVPFFGTDPQLIVGESEAESYRQSSDRPAWSPKITYKDFVDLRQRMVHHLEIMYKD